MHWGIGIKAQSPSILLVHCYTLIFILMWHDLWFPKEHENLKTVRFFVNVGGLWDAFIHWVYIVRIRLPRVSDGKWKISLTMLRTLNMKEYIAHHDSCYSWEPLISFILDFRGWGKKMIHHSFMACCVAMLYWYRNTKPDILLNKLNSLGIQTTGLISFTNTLQ